MRQRVLLPLMLMGAGCGDRIAAVTPPVDAGTSNDTLSPACAIAVGGVTVLVPSSSVVFTRDMLTCIGNSGGNEVDCGSGSATVARATCPDGFAFTMVAGTATLVLRVQGGAQWSVGAQFMGDSPLGGTISFTGLGPSSQLPPPTGTTVLATFALQAMAAGSGQDASASGELSTTW